MISIFEGMSFGRQEIFSLWMKCWSMPPSRTPFGMPPVSTIGISIDSFSFSFSPCRSKCTGWSLIGIELHVLQDRLAGVAIREAEVDDVGLGREDQQLIKHLRGTWRTMFSSPRA